MNSLTANCTGCGTCAEKCKILSELGVPANFDSDMDPTVAFGCALCGRCDYVCPEGLSPCSFFAAMRREAVNKNYIDIDEYRYLFPYRKNSMHNVLRKHMGIDYSDLKSAKGHILFFPGCAMGTYAPQLVRSVYKRMKDELGDIGFSDECCGKPLSLIGVDSRGVAHAAEVTKKLVSRNIKKVLTACPGCYYYMKNVLSECSIEVDTVYPYIGKVELGKDIVTDPITIHDACPDRELGVFANAGRDALIGAGFIINEAPEIRETSPCCGSGGMLSYFREDLSCAWAEESVRQFTDTGAAQAVTHCVSCAMKLGNSAAYPLVKPPTHILNLLTDVATDFFDNKTIAKKLLFGSDIEIWKEIMKD